jgi:phage terminase large subunit
MGVRLTTAYWEVRALTKKYRIIQGSQGASKTYSIATILFEKAKQSVCKSTIVTESYPLLRDGVMADMQNIITDAGLNWDRVFNRTDKNLNIFGSLIQFRNIDNRDFHKSKGPRRDYLFINEANRTHWISVEQMITRTDKAVYIDFNPDREFWAHEQFIDANRDDVDHLILTYEDNECISSGELEEIERRVRASKLPGASEQLKTWVRIYAYGLLGVYAARQIYSYTLVENIPETARRVPSGMDFGVSPDPTCLVDLYLEDNKLYADEIFEQNNLLPEKLKGAERQSVVDKVEEVKHPRGHMIIADSAGRTSILDLRRHGYQIRPVKKKPGAQVPAINQLRGYELYVTARSKNLRKAVDLFYWKIDSNGKVIPEVDGHEPDTLVSIRYVMMMKGRLWN